MKFLLSLGMVLIFCGTALTDITAQSADTTITVKVSGITCANDIKTIKANIDKLEGITECKAVKKGATTSYAIKYNPLVLSKNELDATIEGTPGCEHPDDRPYKVKNQKSKKKKGKRKA